MSTRIITGNMYRILLVSKLWGVTPFKLCTAAHEKRLLQGLQFSRYGMVCTVKTSWLPGQPSMASSQLAGIALQGEKESRRAELLIGSSDARSWVYSRCLDRLRHSSVGVVRVEKLVCGQDMECRTVGERLELWRAARSSWDCAAFVRRPGGNADELGVVIDIVRLYCEPLVAAITRVSSRATVCSGWVRGCSLRACHRKKAIMPCCRRCLERRFTRRFSRKCDLG